VKVSALALRTSFKHVDLEKPRKVANMRFSLEDLPRGPSSVLDMDQMDWVKTSADERVLSGEHHNCDGPGVMGYCGFWIVQGLGFRIVLQ